MTATDFCQLTIKSLQLAQRDYRLGLAIWIVPVRLDVCSRPFSSFEIRTKEASECREHAEVVSNQIGPVEAEYENLVTG